MEMQLLALFARLENSIQNLERQVFQVTSERDALAAEKAEREKKDAAPSGSEPGTAPV